MVDGTLTTVYVAGLLGCGSIALAVGGWAYLTTDAIGTQWFLALMGADAVWSGVATAGLVTTDPTATWLFYYAGAVVGLVTAVLWYLFATVYTRRSLADPRHAVVLVPLAAATVLVATNPLHKLVWTATTYRGSPLSFVATTPGPALGAVNGSGLLAIAVGLYYVGELFVKSRHRASVSLAILLAGMILGTSINLLSTAGFVPVPAYDHTPFGIAVSAVSSEYAIFGLGMFDIRPVARDDLLKEVDDAPLVLDEDERLVDYNTASEPLSRELADGDPIGVPLSDVCPAVDDAMTLPATDESQATDIVSIGNGIAADGAGNGVRESGRLAHYSGRVSPITERGTVVGYSVVLRDVTERVEYREELERRNEQLDRFASAVAHDLWNPLQVAYGRAAVLSETLSADSTEEVGASLDTLRGSLDRIDDIIEDLRALAEKGQSVDGVAPVSIEAAATDAWETVATGEASLHVESTGTVKADRSRLRSVLENLFPNSVEHGAVGVGSVTVRVGLTDGGFYVADDGPASHRRSANGYSSTATPAATGPGLC